MTGEDRRKEIYKTLEESSKPVSGTALAKKFGVSRQVIVQDIAVMRSAGALITPTSHGYFVEKVAKNSRVFKTVHTDDECREELQIIVDNGGRIDDVFVYHRLYGVMRAPLNIKNRHDVDVFLEGVETGKSKLLMNITSNYHYHTVSADDEETLDRIQDALQKRGFLADLQEYEPIDFSRQSRTGS